MYTNYQIWGIVKWAFGSGFLVGFLGVIFLANTLEWWR